ncbi:MAG: hypothetical protein AABZ39_19210 [Spirochaetota bacterium]
MFDTPITYLFAILAAGGFSAVVRFAFSLLPAVVRTREMLSACPAVRTVPGIADIVFREAIAAMEIMLIAAVFIFVRWSLPFDGVARGILYAAAVIVLETVPHIVALALDTSYPRTLLLQQAARDALARLAMGLALGAIIEG